GSFDRVFVDEASAPFWTPLLDKCANERRRVADRERLERSERLKRLGARNVDGGESEARRNGCDFDDGTPILFRHCDSLDLAGKLRRYLPPGARPLVVTDGVFADCGTVAPLDEYAASLRRFPGAALAVNDSHGVGVLGARGRGTLEYFGFDLSRVNETSRETESEAAFEPEAFDDEALGASGRSANGRRDGVRVYMFASLAKAVGGFGCVAPGSELFVEKLTERCEELCGAIPSNPIAAATARGLRILTKAPDLRTRLRENAERLRVGLRALRLEVADSPSPIVSFRVGTPQNMRRIQRALANERILISYLPARGDGARGALRVAVFATHSPEMIDALVEKLRDVL
ncbi:MAG: pyridoxal phosphate-dependent aminotransferase family protein, partial [Thermoguttaceae bacterium]|nr:pyridoxal phosphate-dependent aminotransferase family protein [Thermoguttaceae bacterium]